MNEYRVTIKVQNNYMLTAMQNSGIKNGSQLAKLSGVTPNQVGHYLNLKSAPMRKDGEWKVSILKISDCLGVMISDLFPPEHLEETLASNKTCFEVSKQDLQTLGVQSPPDELYDLTKQGEFIGKALDTLSDRERSILEYRTGLLGEEKTYEQIAVIYDVTRERIRQIEAKALRKLRHPTRVDILTTGYVSPENERYKIGMGVSTHD